MYRSNKGFTLVEVIVVVAIIAILGAVTIPSFEGYIVSAGKGKAILECRNAVTAAQTLYIEHHSDPDSVTAGDIKTTAGVDGEISNIEAANLEPVHLTYTNSDWVVTYCRNYSECSLHEELYNVSKVGASDPEDPGSESTADYFYIADDANYKVSTLGDLAVYDFGEYGTTVPHRSVFYWQGSYYFTRDAQYLTNSSDRSAYINNYGIKINKSSLTTPGASTAPGDLKLDGGKVYIFYPYARYQNDYADPNYWLEVTLG